MKVGAEGPGSGVAGRRLQEPWRESLALSPPVRVLSIPVVTVRAPKEKQMGGVKTNPKDSSRLGLGVSDHLYGSKSGALCRLAGRCLECQHGSPEACKLLGQEIAQQSPEVYRGRK